MSSRTYLHVHMHSYLFYESNLRVIVIVILSYVKSFDPEMAIFQKRTTDGQIRRDARTHLRIMRIFRICRESRDHFSTNHSDIASQL